MSVIVVLILASLAVGLLFLGAFVWSVRTGQYDDTLTPALRMLLEDAPLTPPIPDAGGPSVPLPASAVQPRNEPTKTNHANQQ